MKTLKYLFIATLAIFAFNACEDVPEPYEIPTINDAGGGSNVSTPEGEGTLESPYNPAGANAYISALEADKNSDKAIYVKGIICSIKEKPNSQYGNATFYISADGKTTSEQFYVFRCYNLENKKFTDNDVLNVGDEVIIYGKVVNYRGNTPETVQNEAYIYSHSATTDEPEETVEMTVAEAIDNFIEGKEAIVKGYIVGWVEGTKYEEGVRFNNEIPNTPDTKEQTDILLADSPDETDVTKCIPVQLPSGDIRNKVNLQDNPDNYKKFVTLTGILQTYFKKPGLKSVTKALFEGEEDNEGDDNTQEPTGKIYLKETFAESLGTFKTEQLVNDYAWKHEVYNSKAYAKVSGFANGESQDAESWLISPAINLTGETAARITFDYVINKGDASLASKNHQLMITDNYTGDFITTEWTAIDFGATNDNTWTFRSASAAIPAQFIGKSAVVIAFKYTSTKSASSTWEVNNVVVSGDAADQGGNTGGDNTGDGEDTPDTPTGESLLANDSFENWNGTTPLNWAGSSIGHNASISQSSDAHTGSYAVLVQGATANKRLASQSYKLTKGTYTISAYIKNGDKGAGQHRIGYGIITDGKIENSNYKYITDPTPAAEEWTEVKGEFTLDSATEVTILVMNSKVGNGAPILVDDVTLTTNDGGIAEGSDDNEGSGDENEGDEGTEGTTFTYTATTTVEPGKYIIVAGNNLLLPLDETQNYGYMKVTSVTPSNGTITTGDSNVFTLEATTGGYTIKDAYGRYVYMTGNYNSFNVSTTMPSADEATWTITFNAQGNAIIKNKYSEKTLQFDSQYNSYGAYPDERGTYPVLYKMN